MLPAQKPLLELVGALYDTAAAPENWEQFLRLAVLRFKAERAGFALHDGANNLRSAIPYSVGISPEGIREFDAYYGRINPTHEVLRGLLARNGYWHGLARELVPTDRYVRTEYYNDWGQKYGSYSRVLGVVGNPAGKMTSLSIIRSERKPLFGRDAAQLMAFLFPHLRGVVQIRAALDSLAFASKTAARAIDAVEHGIIAVNGRGEVVLLNVSAEEMIRKNDGLSLKDKKLSVAHPESGEQLELLVLLAARTGAGRGLHPGGALLIPRRSGAPLQILVTPFRSCSLFADESPCALVFLNDPDAKISSRGALLAGVYRLSPSECRLADYLMQGMELVEAAECMRVTPATARFMLKSIFRKTETHRQPELVRFLLRLPACPVN